MKQKLNSALRTLNLLGTICRVFKVTKQMFYYITIILLKGSSLMLGLGNRIKYHHIFNHLPLKVVKRVKKS